MCPRIVTRYLFKIRFDLLGRQASTRRGLPHAVVLALPPDIFASHVRPLYRQSVHLAAHRVYGRCVDRLLCGGTGTKLRAHAGRGYRAPSFYERFGTFYSSFGYGIYGDPRLHPNRSLGGDAGIDQSFVNGRMRASATYFYTRLQEVIGFNSIPGTRPLRQVQWIYESRRRTGPRR